MPFYRKKPVVIEAVQWLGSMADVIALVGHDLPTAGPPHAGGLLIETREGIMVVSPSDWIIKGIAGEFYPCGDSIFQATYEPIDEAMS